MNPFKFGTVVDEPFFIDRTEELARINQLIDSENHLFIVSPRRYGKTSLIRKALQESSRRFIMLDMQLVLSATDFAAQLLKRIYRISAINKLKSYLKSFRIVPSLAVNPVTGEVDVSFAPGQEKIVPLEDVLNLINDLGNERKRTIVVMDEFQDIFRIDKDLDRILRSIMQGHSNVNYIFAGSAESMIREIFENKKSPFYHFAYMMPLKMIPEEDFLRFLEGNFKKVTENYRSVSTEILKVTGSHPHYTQQLASVVWDMFHRSGSYNDIIQKAVDEILQHNDNNFERLWNGFNRTDRKVLIGMSKTDVQPLSREFLIRFDAGPDSTVYSSLQRLITRGIVIREEGSYLFDDPFFKRWIIIRRER